MSLVDIAQTEKYKKMLGLTNLITSKDNNTILIANTTILGKLYVSGYSNLFGSCTILSNLYVDKKIIFNTNVSGKNIYSNTNIINNNITVAGNLLGTNIIINGKCDINNNAVINNLNVNNIVVTNNTYLLNNLSVNNILSNDRLCINGDYITFGNINSEIILTGTRTYFATSEINLYDKCVVINNNPTDIGNNAGIEIKSTGLSGFIRTNTDSTRFELKIPNNNNIRYIATLDNNNNLNISGNTILYGNTTIAATLVINGDTTIFGNSKFNAQLITTGNTIFQNSVTALSNINIGGNTNIKGNVSILSSFNIMSTANLNQTTITSNLNINGNTIISGSLSVVSKLNIFGSTMLYGKTTINSNLYISNNLIIKGTSTILSSINVNGYANINGNITIGGDLLVSDISLFSGNNILKSNLNINNNLVIEGNITLGSLSLTEFSKYSLNNNNLNNFQILGQIISSLPEYKNNIEASAKIPLWTFYRTGGILKIRLDDIPPKLVLLGNTTIILNKTNIFIDPGINTTDNVDNIIDTYLISISNSVVPNIIKIPYLLNNNIIISETSILDSGSYNIVYSATDECGNVGYITRFLIIV